MEKLAKNTQIIINIIIDNQGINKLNKINKQKYNKKKHWLFNKK